MKNVCIVVKKRITAECGGENLPISALQRSGYAFEEIRVLPQADEKKIQTTLVEVKKEYENILLLVDKTALPIVREYLSVGFPAATQVTAFGSAGIYTDKQATLLFLSSDETETGLGFVENVALPYLQEKYGVRYEKILLRAVGANEGRMQALLSEAFRYSAQKIKIEHYRKYAEDRVEITYDSTAPKMAVDEVVRLFADGLGDTVYALNGISLEEQLVTLLKLRGKKLSVAESFTGGGIAKRITSVSGASEVYFEGLNTYDELSKMKRLGVSEYALRTVGAVSDQTAYEMALGLLNTGDCDISLATTGLAGPKSDRSMLPVGLCYVAVGTKEKIFVYRYKFEGSRKDITETAINYALFMAYKHLKNI